MSRLKSDRLIAKLKIDYRSCYLLVLGNYTNGHGNASLDFFKRIQTKHQQPPGKLSAYFSTHPLTEARINYLHQVAKNNQWQMTGEVTDLPTVINQQL